MLRRSHLRAVAVLVVAAAGVAAGCGAGSTAEKRPAPGILLESRGLAQHCDNREDIECWGGSRPNAALGPGGLVLVVWQGAYAPTELESWARMVDATKRRPVGRLLKLRLGLYEPGELLLLDGDERGWTVQLRNGATRVSPDGSQRPARTKLELERALDPAVTFIGRGCGGGAIRVAAGGGPPLIIGAGEDERMRIDPGVCGL